MCIFLHLPVISPLSDPDILLSILFSDASISVLCLRSQT
jgi:hypothetical protein